MRIVYCSEYLERREADAYAKVKQLQTQLAHPGLIGRVRLALGFPSVELQQQRVQLQEGMVAAARLTKGRDGEQMLIDTLAQRLDDRYLLFYSYPGRALDSGGDVDGVLVGPHGITIYEVKAWNGVYAASDTGWKFHLWNDQRWEPAHANPNKQVLRHAAGMQTLMRQQGVKADIVYPTVAIASQRMHVDAVPPMSVSLIYLVAPKLAMNELLGTRTPATMTPTQTKQIEKNLLDRLAAGKRKIVTLPRTPIAAQMSTQQSALPMLRRLGPLTLAVLIIAALIVIACLSQAAVLLLHHH